MSGFSRLHTAPVVAVAMGNKGQKQIFVTIPYQEHIVDVPPIVNDMSEEGIVFPNKILLTQPW